MVERRKILFAGLDNSGKTSFIRAIQKRFSALQTKPTIGLERNTLKGSKVLGMDFMAWDLGGQLKFRENYLKQKYRIFGSTSTIFFLIDVQDKKRFPEMKEYLMQIVNTLKELKEAPRLIFCMHKVDPDIREDPIIRSTIKELSSDLDILTKPLEIKFHETTIHDHASIVKAFSRGALYGHPKQNLIQQQLKEYARYTFSSATVLLDENSLIIASQAKDQRLIEMSEMIAPRFILALERVDHYQIIPETLILHLLYDPSGELKIVNSQNELNNSINNKDQNQLENKTCGKYGKDQMNYNSNGNGISNGKKEKAQKMLFFMRSFVLDSGLTFYLVSISRNPSTYKLANQYLPKLAIQLSSVLNALEY